MVKQIRETLSNEEGQALVIGGLMLLLLAFGILVTLNIGRAVEEKIKLQNASDASAYSLAVLEAQAFNYVAFTNRVQASHYNSIMLVQGYANFLLLIEGILGTFIDYLWTMSTVVTWIGNILSVIPIIQAVGVALQEFGDMLYEIGDFIYDIVTEFRELLYGDEEDVTGGLLSLMGELRKILWYVNYVQYFTEAIYTGLITIKLAGGMKDVNDMNLGKNEINMNNTTEEGQNSNGGGFSLSSLVRFFGSILNIVEYYQTFDPIGGRPLLPLLPSTDNGLRALKAENDSPEDYDHFNKRDKAIRANQRIMAEIANATRSERDSGWARNWIANNTRRGFRFPGDLSLGGFGNILKKFIDISVEGQTKLATYVAEPEGISWQGDFSGESVYQHLEEIQRKNSKNHVSSDRRYFYANDEGKDKEFYKAGTDRYRVDMYRPTGDVMASYEHFRFWMGIKISALSFLGLGKISLGQAEISPAIVSDRNGGRIYRWRLPAEWIVNLMEFRWTRFYFRVPGSVWEMLGLFQIPINVCAKGLLVPVVAGLPFFGCRSVSVPRNEGCRGFCFLKFWGKCWIKASCTWLPGLCCELRKFLDNLRFRTFEKITQKDSDGGDSLNQWWLGIGPFMKFKPDYRRRKDFNQPSTWSILNNPPENFMEGNEWNLDDHNYKISTGSVFNDGSNDKDLTVNPLINDEKRYTESGVLGVGDINIFGAGLNAVSRARVYYHRPGNWEEPPNMMNPYWRAQLAPIAQKLVPYLKNLQEKIQSVLEPVVSMLDGINTGINFIDGLAGGLSAAVGAFASDGLSTVIVGLISH